MVTFDEKKHIYIDTESGKQLTSATTLIGKYKPPFDKQGNAAKVAAREGVSVDFVLETWHEAMTSACDYGTMIHKVMEDYLADDIKDPQHQSFYDSYQKWDHIFNKFPLLTCEKMLYSIEENIAGTGDLIYENPTHFYVGDYKTNKAFRFINEFNEYFKAPLEHLGVCEFNTYALQLSLYAYMYERSSGKKCAGLVIFYRNKVDNTWYPIRLNYLKMEVKAMVEDFNLNHL